MKEELIPLINRLNDEISGLKSALMVVTKTVFTNTEIRELFGVSAKTIKKWRDDGLLGYSLVGDTYLYTKEDVEEFLCGIHHSPQLLKIRL